MGPRWQQCRPHHHPTTLHQRTHPAPFEQKLSLGRRTTQGVRQILLRPNNTTRRPQKQLTGCDRDRGAKKNVGLLILCHISPPAQSVVFGFVPHFRFCSLPKCAAPLYTVASNCVISLICSARYANRDHRLNESSERTLLVPYTVFTKGLTAETTPDAASPSREKLLFVAPCQDTVFVKTV